MFNYQIQHGNITVTSHEHHGISNHRQLECLFDGFLRLATKYASNYRTGGHLWRESTGRKAFLYCDICMLINQILNNPDKLWCINFRSDVKWRCNEALNDSEMRHTRVILCLSLYLFLFVIWSGSILMRNLFRETSLFCSGHEIFIGHGKEL